MDLKESDALELCEILSYINHQIKKGVSILEMLSLSKDTTEKKENDAASLRISFIATVIAVALVVIN